MPPRQVIFLTGAPEHDSVDWNENELSSSFIWPIQRFLGEAVRNNSITATQISQLPPKWRQIPFADRSEHVNKAVAVVGPLDTARFWSSQDHAAADPHHASFLEHSLAVLQDLESSQIEPPEGAVPDQTTAFNSTSFNTTLSTDLSLTTSSDSLVTYSSDRAEQQIVSFNGPITDLRRVPNARHILSIHPQTMTVNVLAGVISVQPTRTVRTRRTNVDMDIIEVLMGDDTRAGFSISFWLPAMHSQSVQQNTGKEGLRTILNDVRSGDVLLVTHIALSEFQGNVYGQSLSRRITRNNTTVTVLLDNVTGLSMPNAAKLNRVRAWSAHFTGKRRAPSPSLLRGEGQKRRKALDLPPDTQ